ncbi:MAG: hypothetical protein PVI80_23285 [Anaerolineae bacterium]|jgi:hypothetical protein
MKPIVDGLERDWDTGQVLRLEFTEPAVRAFGEQVGFEITPTFILYDGDGQEVRRWVGSPPALEELVRETDLIQP